MNTQQLILTALEECYPNLLPHKALLSQVNMSPKCTEPVLPSEFRRELDELIPAEVTKIDDRDKGFVYTITARGRARIA